MDKIFKASETLHHIHLSIQTKPVI